MSQSRLRVREQAEQGVAGLHTSFGLDIARKVARPVKRHERMERGGEEPDDVSGCPALPHLFAEPIGCGYRIVVQIAVGDLHTAGIGRVLRWSESAVVPPDAGHPGNVGEGIEQEPARSR